jgi:hypothetical protein
MIYQWKQNRYAVEAQKAGEELERIKCKHGSIVPKSVIDESRPMDAVLHKCFEWNDKVAAESYREVQAREIIRNIVIVKNKDNDEGEQIIVRAFWPVVTGDEEAKKYISIEEAISDDNYKKQMIEQAKSEMIAMKKRYGDLLQFIELVKTYLLEETA